MKRSNRSIPQRTNRSRPLARPKPFIGKLSRCTRAIGSLRLWSSAVQATKTFARHARGLLYAGVICYLAKDYPAAETYLKAAAAAGNSADAYTNLALTLAAMHRLTEAEEAYRRTVALNPKTDRAWNNLGNILKNSFNAERREEALHCYRRAIAANPKYANAYSNLGHALDSTQGDKAGAEESFRAAITCDPGHLQAILNLADILERTKRPNEALASRRQALALQPTNFQVLGRILGLRRSLADWDKA